jgi:hypothetical protein
LTTPGSPNVRRKRLAAELRAIRDDRGENLQTVVSALGPGWSTSKLSRYELGTGGLNPREVERLLDHYRAPGPLRERLLGLARAASGKGWWDAFSDVAPSSYRDFIGLEAEASSVEVWHVEVVTGLLQTERYARSLIAEYSSRVEPIAPAIIERLVKLRMRRKVILEEEDSVSLIVVLDESVLKRQFGDDSVMCEQMQSLAADSARPNITLRVLPLRTPHVSAESFVIFRFGPENDAILHDVVYTEGLKGSFSLEHPQETYVHRLVFDTLLGATLDAEASRDLILRVADYWRHPL